MRRGLGIFILAKAPHTLAHNDLEVLLLVTPITHVSPVNAHCEGALRLWQEDPITGAAVSKAGGFVSQRRFQSLGHLERVIPHRFDVQSAIKWQKVLEGLEAQPVGHQRGPLGFHRQEFRATGSVSSADNGRNDVVLCRVQSQCSHLGLENVKVPNKVRNERLPWALSLSGVPQSGHIEYVSRKVLICCWRRWRWRVLRSCLDSARLNPRCSMRLLFLLRVMTSVTVSS